MAAQNQSLSSQGSVTLRPLGKEVNWNSEDTPFLQDSPNFSGCQTKMERRFDRAGAVADSKTVKFNPSLGSLKA